MVSCNHHKLLLLPRERRTEAMCSGFWTGCFSSRWSAALSFRGESGGLGDWIVGLGCWLALDCWSSDCGSVPCSPHLLCKLMWNSITHRVRSLWAVKEVTVLTVHNEVRRWGLNPFLTGYKPYSLNITQSCSILGRIFHQHLSLMFPGALITTGSLKKERWFRKSFIFSSCAPTILVTTRSFIR